MFSLWVHINAVLGRQVAPQEYFIALHLGIFVVWIPAVFALQRLANQTRFSWKLVLRGAPSWMRYVGFAFFAYAFVNFAFFISQSSRQDPANQVSAGDWRGFSGHWMLFYSTTVAILYSALRVQDARVRCPKGHLVSDTAQICAECGRPIASA